MTMTESPGTTGVTGDRLTADFFRLQRRLTGPERESVLRVRQFCETEVRPIANDYWSRGEFPMHLVPRLAELGLFGSAWPETRAFENSAVYRLE